MIKDIGEDLAEYSDSQGYYFLTEYASGANQALDAFLHSKKDYALWYNILETGQGTFDEYGRTMQFNRQIEFLLLTPSQTKDDMGENYYPQIQDCLNRIIHLVKHLSTSVGVKSFTTETYVDQNDATLTGAKLTIITQENQTAGGCE